MRTFTLSFLIALLTIGCSSELPKLTKKNLQNSLCRHGSQFRYKAEDGWHWSSFRVLDVPQKDPLYVKVKVSEKGVRKDSRWPQWIVRANDQYLYQYGSRIAVYELRRDSTHDDWYIATSNGKPILRYGIFKRYLEINTELPEKRSREAESSLAAYVVFVSILFLMFLIGLLFLAKSEIPAMLKERITDKAKIEKQRDLQQAVADGRVDRVKHLLAAGADVNGRATLGVTPLMLAAETAQTDMVQFLLDKGALPNRRDFKHGATALMAAAKSGNIEIVKTLLDRGAEVNGKSRRGRTPLFYAAAKNHVEIVRLLLNNSAIAAARDKTGWTALRIAAKFDYPDVVRLLREAGATQ